ncbi:MAG: hypothetical protein FWE37_09360, partial [Spirochaetaceae bacterium]|nr:hypothetical protein [Spirochaetaceae bacterium]
MTPIASISKTTVKSFAEEPVNSFWQEKNLSLSSSLPTHDYAKVLSESLTTLPANSVVCLFTEELSSPSLLEALAKARDSGHRIYILTSSSNSKLKELDGCLIRYGDSGKIGSFMLINPNSSSARGYIFTGSLTDGSLAYGANLLLNLDLEQSKVLFRYFCYQFWHKAEREFLAGQNYEVKETPIDIFPPNEDSCDFAYLQKLWALESKDAFIAASLLANNNYFNFTHLTKASIYTLLSGIDDKLVKALKQNENKIFASEGIVLPNIVQINDKIWLVPKIDNTFTESIYSILLNDEQKKDVTEHFNQVLQQTACYEYNESKLRGELAGQTIFMLGDEPNKKYKIEAEKQINLGENTLSELLPKHEFENCQPEFADDGKAITITYNWLNKPF